MMNLRALRDRLPGPETCQWILIAVAIAVMLPGLGRQPLDYFDEVKTAERSRSFSLTGDWLCVQENGLPSFNKPPLHYWITAGFLKTPLQPEVAIRLLAALSGILCVFLTIRLARQLDPDKKWLGVAAGSLLMLYGPFIEYARVGVLDTTATALLLGALLFAHRALTQPLNWYGVAIIATLGALHKTPLILLFWIVVLAGIAAFSNSRQVLQSRHLWIALTLGIIGVAAWPLLQSLRFGSAYIEGYGEFELKQMVSRDRNLGPATYLVWITKKWFLFAGLGLAGTLWLTLRKNASPYLRSLMLTGLIFFVIASCLTGHSHRYLFPILPLLSIAIGIVGTGICRNLPVTSAVFLVLNVAGAGVTAVVHRGLDHRGFDNQLPLVEKFRVLAPESDEVLVVRDDQLNATIFTYFTRFYADLEKRTPILQPAQLIEAAAPARTEPMYVFLPASLRETIVSTFPEAEWVGSAGDAPEIHLFRIPPR